MEEETEKMRECYRQWGYLTEVGRKKYNEEADKTGTRAMDVFINKCMEKQKQNKETSKDVMWSMRRILNPQTILGFLWKK